MLDVLFSLLLPELKPVAGLELHQRVFTWGGVDYPQEPITYHWSQYVVLTLSQQPPYLQRFLPRGYGGKGWLCFDLNGEAFELWGSELQGDEVDWDNGRLDDLLRILLTGQDKWVMIVEPYYDQIDHTYRLNAAGCIEKLKSALGRGIYEEGFIVIGAAT